MSSWGLRARCRPSTTYATAAIANGADVKSVQKLLGHASAKTTLDVYAGNDDEAMRRAAEGTAAAMRQVPQGAKTFKTDEAAPA